MFYVPEHFFAGRVNIAADYPLYRLQDDAAAVANLDSAWHTYRVEVIDKTITCLMGGTRIHQINIPVNTQPGSVGI